MKPDRNIPARCWIIAWLCFCLVARAGGKTWKVNPDMDAAGITGTMQSAAAGDTVRFGPGTYEGPFRLDELHGAPDLAVVITAEDPDRTVVEGRAFVLSDCSWIRIERITVRKGRGNLVSVKNSSYISLGHCRFGGGRRVLAASGNENHHFLVEHCTWERPAGRNRSCLFRAKGISGVYVLRGNNIRTGREGFRMTCAGGRDPDLPRRLNGETYGNTLCNAPDGLMFPEGTHGEGPVPEGPPFRHVEPPDGAPYLERPRIVRHRWEGLTFSMWFSAPLTKSSVDGLRAAVASGGEPYLLGPPDLLEDGYCLTFSTRPMERRRTGQEAPGTSRPEIRAAGNPSVSSGDRLPAGRNYPTLILNKWPAGRNGMPATGWASTLPVRAGDLSLRK